MDQDYKKLFDHFNMTEPSEGLFDRILLIIKREQELRQNRKLALGFLALLVISFIAMPFSLSILAVQAESSGIVYFILIALNGLGGNLAVWGDFALAIGEALPIWGMVIFALNVSIAVFTLRLFLHRKKILFGYFFHGVRFV